MESEFHDDVWYGFDIQQLKAIQIANGMHNQSVFGWFSQRAV